MIFVRDKGRLCNNILQYGHVYAWGREHGRKTMSMRFAYKYQYFRICHTPRHNLLLYLIAKYAAKCHLLPVVTFDQPPAPAVPSDTAAVTVHSIGVLADAPADAPAAMLQHRHLIVQGWYARWYDLFLKYKDEIIDLFAFDDKVKVRPDRLLEGLKADNRTLILGVHVRRGDYRTFYDGRFFYTDQQYVDIIRQFLSLHNDQPVHIFICGSERTLDSDYYRSHLSPLTPHPSPHKITLDFPDGNPGEDLYLLSQCDYLIGPPSTFSLVASMYRDVPLYWIEDPAKPLTEDSFRHFDYLFRHIY